MDADWMRHHWLEEIIEGSGDYREITWRVGEILNRSGQIGWATIQ